MNKLSREHLHLRITVNTFMQGSLGFPKHETAHPALEILQNIGT